MHMRRHLTKATKKLLQITIDVFNSSAPKLTQVGVILTLDSSLDVGGVEGWVTDLKPIIDSSLQAMQMLVRTGKVNGQAAYVAGALETLIPDNFEASGHVVHQSKHSCPPKLRQVMLRPGLRGVSSSDTALPINHE